MCSLFYSISFLLTILIHAVSCEHEYQYNHQNDKWSLILSKIESLWKNKTDAPSTSSTERTEPLDQGDDKWPLILSKNESLWKNKTDAPSTSTEQTERDQEGNHWNSHDVESTTELLTTPVVQNGTFIENVKETFRSSLALLIGLPIAGITVLCCFCYCCLKCCSVCCEDSEEGKVIVVQQNNVQPSHQPPAHHTQVILQQPVYQTPVYTMQPAPPQYGSAPQQQWAAPPHQHHPEAYDNPNYGEPSAPPPQYGKY